MSMSLLKHVSFLCLFLSIVLYFFGYVPKTVYRKHNNENRSYFKQKNVDKVVLIVIDSLRHDMVFNKMNLWPNMQRYFNQSWAYPTIATIQPPSMSLAKIKCIITGAIVGFIDVMFNTDSGKIEQDNLIDILRKYRKFEINFYGDITWMKLFPSQFNFKDPTTPFFVRDYFEVDNNVSRNIPDIISASRTWDMVIMHYLGLDHIGHAEGPFTPASDKKLTEMDKNIGVLIDALMARNDADKSLIILTADHGMSDLGGHGGSSINEINVPMIFLSKRFQQLKTVIPELISQNDIAPSLALVLGVPIPADNVGVIPLPILSLIDHPLNQSNALLSNYFQMSKIVYNLPESISKQFHKLNSSIHLIHQLCSTNYSSRCIQNLKQRHRLLIKLINDIKEILKTQFIQHNFLMLEIGHFLSAMSLLISIVCLLIAADVSVSVAGILFTLSLSSLFLTSLYVENRSLCQFTAFKLSLSALMIVLTGHTLTGFKQFVKAVLPKDQNFISMEFAVLLSLVISLFCSGIPSYIKEENQVWFYLNNTFLFLYLLKEVISKTILNKEPITMKTTYFAAILILITDRFLITLNQTGELWSHIPDLGDWFMREENKIFLLVTIGICLPIVGVMYWDNRSNIFSLQTQLLVLLNGIHRYADIEGLKMISDISVWIYYAVLAFQIIFSLILRKMSLIPFTFGLSRVLFFTSFIVCRHQNICLWAGIAFKRILYRKIWQEEIRNYPQIYQCIIFNIIGMSTFFQQGNSNSLTTLDVQPGFVGMTSFIPPIIFPVVAIHTFAGNMYWMFIWFEWLSKDLSSLRYKPVVDQEIIPQGEIHTVTDSDVNSQNEEILIQPESHQNVQFSSQIALSLIVISASSLFPLYIFSVMYKHQITAWSVFAPKLLYQCFHSGILLFVYSIVVKLLFW